MRMLILLRMKYVINSLDSGQLYSSHLDQLLHAQHCLVLKIGCPVICLSNTDTFVSGKG